MKLTSLFAATTLVATISAIVLWRQLHVERAVLAEAHFVGERQNPSPPTQSASTPNEPAASVASTYATAPAEANPTAAFADDSSAPIPMRNPAYCASIKNSARIALNDAYPEVGKALALSPQDTEALFDILFKQQAHFTDMGCGSNETRAEARRAGGQAIKEADEAVQKLLGMAKYNEWLEYQKTKQARQRIAQLEKAIATDSTPLRPEQAELLISTKLAEDRMRMKVLESRVRPANPADIEAYDNANLQLLEQSYGRILTTLQSSLSSQQLAIAEAWVAKQISRERGLQQSRRQQSAGSTAGATVPVISTFR